jgi:hypothetical protein
VNFQVLFNLPDFRSSVRDDGAVGHSDDIVAIGLLFMFVANIADNFLQQVLQRDQPGGAAYSS